MKIAVATATLALISNASAFAPSLTGSSTRLTTSLNSEVELQGPPSPEAAYYASTPEAAEEVPPPGPPSTLPAVHHHGVAHGKWPHDPYASATVEEFEWINNQERNYGKQTPNIYRHYDKELDMSCGIKQGWPHGPHSHVITHEHEWTNNQQRSYGHEKENVYRHYDSELNLSSGMPRESGGHH